MGNNLLLNSRPLVIIPELAIAIGLNESIVLQQIHYWCNINQEAGKNYRDGYYWVYNSYSEWAKQFPWWCERTIKTIFGSLEKRGLLISGNYNKLRMDRTKWYRINYDALGYLTANSPSCNICTMDSAGFARPISETNTKNNHNGKMEQWIAVGQSPTPVSQSSKQKFDGTPIVEHRNEDIAYFIEWYFDLYQARYGVEHPNIKSQQKVRVTNVLSNFMEENDLDIEALQDMANAFFDNVDSDHNINHFATSGILENRFYEAVY